MKKIKFGAFSRANDTSQKNAANWTMQVDLESNKCMKDHKIIQRYLLSVFYHSAGGENWSNKDGWLEEEDECGWYGVSCNEDSSVTEISLGE